MQMFWQRTESSSISSASKKYVVLYSRMCYCHRRR